ncbi:hypothetical protein L873DRAFT_1814999 [Choiromyces venosus 120613-1]|uniref:Secreted protein n=1 Tax=Choiromyces venosus 120613-1 TaxID=1336337 RepID=A0A3N4J794_9PEZI|nr:hypothetical protein L873DRAFT_1814999 [Choiromyces venosus 120613-1]
MKYLGITLFPSSLSSCLQLFLPPLLHTCSNNILTAIFANANPTPANPSAYIRAFTLNSAAFFSNTTCTSCLKRKTG